MIICPEADWPTSVAHRFKEMLKVGKSWLVRCACGACFEEHDSHRLTDWMPRRRRSS